MSDFKFPVETIDLPSGGKLYPEGHPLRSGRIDVKYMTAKEEDILTSTNLIQKGLVLDKLMESLIVTPGVKPDDLLVGDLNAVMVAARVLAYGKDYPVQLFCTQCNNKFDYVADLSTLDMILTEELPDKDGEYSVTLPTGVTVTFKLLTRGKEREIQAEIDALKKLNGSLESDTTTRLRFIITSVNGNRDKTLIKDFSEAMIIRDVRALREKIREVSPDIDFDLSLQCVICESQVRARLPIGANFFWPDFGR